MWMVYRSGASTYSTLRLLAPFPFLPPCLRLAAVGSLGYCSSAAGSDDIDTDWDRELGLVGPGTGRTGEPSPNNSRDLRRANIAEGLKALLRGANESSPQEGKDRP